MRHFPARARENFTQFSTISNDFPSLLLCYYHFDFVCCIIVRSTCSVSILCDISEKLNEKSNKRSLIYEKKLCHIFKIFYKTLLNWQNFLLIFLTNDFHVQVVKKKLNNFREKKNYGQIFFFCIPQQSFMLCNKSLLIFLFSTCSTHSQPPRAKYDTMFFHVLFFFSRCSFLIIIFLSQFCRRCLRLSLFLVHNLLDSNRQIEMGKMFWGKIIAMIN